MTARSARAALLLLVVAALGVYAATRVRLSADFSAFLPAGATSAQRALIQQLREGVAGRLMLIELAGAPVPRLAKASRELAATLAEDPAFTYVANGDPTQAKHDFDFIFEHRYALSRDVDAARFSVSGLHAALVQRLEELYGSAAPLVKATLARDPTGEALSVVRALLPQNGPRNVDGVWFDRSGTRALLIAATRAPASDLAAQSEAVDALLHAYAATVAQAGATTLAYSSPGVLAVASRKLIADQAEVLSLVSAFAIIIVLALAYRAPVPVLLCAVPAAVGLLAGLCAVYAVLGRLNGITLAFGATLLGEAVDYPSFLFTQIDRAEAPTVARARIAPVFRLAVFTTACSGLALLTSGFPGLLELGTLTLVGILVAGAITWWFVPDWVPTGFGRPTPAIETAKLHLPMAPAVRWLVLGAILALLAAVDRGPVFDDDLSHLNPLPLSLVARDRTLREALHAPDVRSLVLIRGGDQEDVLRKGEGLRPVLEAAVAAHELGSFDLASDVLPSKAAQAQRRAALPDAATLHAKLAQAVIGTPFRLSAFAFFERDIAAARAAPAITLHDLSGTALGLRAEALLGHDILGEYLVVPLRDLRRPDAVAARIDAAREPGVTWLDLREESAALLGVYRQKVLVSIASAVLLIGGSIAIGLRDIRRAVRAVAPVLMAAALATAILRAAGVLLTIFHLVALVLVLGIGVNYALFADRARQRPRESSRIGRTIFVVSATTMCAFATLALSSIPVLRALGVTVVTGVIACLAVLAFVTIPVSGKRVA